MRAALKLAERGAGRTAPNPAVGCVIADDQGHRIAEGYHARAGEPHAEAVALADAGPRARGATMYVTLEPCSHWGRTPPCTEGVVQAGIKRVVAAMKDPDPRVSGRGFRALREAGVKVEIGLCGAEARRLNAGYLKFKANGLPFVLLKMAMTLDGKIATAAGESRWITAAPARSYVQELRDRYDAVLIGVQTAVTDDPSLTVRSEELPAGYFEKHGRTPRSPARVILDSHARLTPGARVLGVEGRCLVLTTPAADRGSVNRLERAGAEVVALPAIEDRVDLVAALRWLGEHGIHTVLCEGGAEIAWSLVAAGLVDRVLFFIAPRLIGGREAPGPVGGRGVGRMQDALALGPLRVRRFGPDLAVEADVVGQGSRAEG